MTDHKQPESPQHEGVDPLTKGDTLYPRDDTKADSTFDARTSDDASNNDKDSNKAGSDEPTEPETPAKKASK